MYSKSFYRVKMQLSSALHIGKGCQDEFLSASGIVQNGMGEYILPGTTFAGKFLETLRESNNTSLDSSLLKDLANEDQQDPSASLLVFRSVVLSLCSPKVRDRNRNYSPTRTAADKAKFAQWELTSTNSVEENFVAILEIDNLSRSSSPGNFYLNDERYKTLQTWVEMTLSVWMKYGVYFGADSSNGNGFCKVKEIKKTDLNKTNFDTYLENSYQGLAYKDEFWENFQYNVQAPSPYSKTFDFILNVDEENPLLIKSNITQESQYTESPDAVFINRDGIPYIPGSSYKGAISAFMHKYQRTDWETALGKGDCDHAGYLIFNDLLLQDKGILNSSLVKVEHHAECQFSRAVFGTGKFDEERLFKGQFQGSLLIKKSMGTELLKAILNDIEFLGQSLNKQMVPLGAGACHPAVVIKEVK
jgi:hypothetical protein